MIKYSEATINKVKQVYPLRSDLIEMAIKGSEALRPITDELAGDIITALEIVRAFESDKKEDLRNLYDRAKTAMAKHEVYNMVMEDYYHSFDPETKDEEKYPESEE